MKWLVVLVLSGCAAFAQTEGARTVYILPMAGGLDQYLAAWLTRDHVMQVVTDPKDAGVVLTDRIGESFAQKLIEIHPPDENKDAKEKQDTKTAGAGAAGTIRNEFRSTRGQGTIFLVDAKSRRVLWSDYEKPNSQSQNSLNREARRIAKKLHDTYTDPKSAGK